MDVNKTASHLGEDVSSAVKHVADLGRTAGEKLDEARLGTADALAGAASSVRITGHEGSKSIDNLAERAASKLDSTAAYVRNLGDLFGKMQQVVRRHPTSFLVGAAAVGFLLGSATRRSRGAPQQHGSSGRNGGPITDGPSEEESSLQMQSEGGSGG